VTTADAKYLKDMREKMATYPRLAREALRRREYDKANEYWRLWHEELAELLKHFGAALSNVDCSNRDL
jgi:hypothetical protein